MSAAEIDAYLAQLDEPKRGTLEQLRRDILSAVPDVEQVISYSMPGFRLRGKMVAGFAAFKNHLSYLPHSGAVLSAMESELSGYTTTPGSLHFAIDTPLPKALVARLLDVRMTEAFGARGRQDPQAGPER